MTSYYIQTNLICLILLLGLEASLHRRKGTLSAQNLVFSRMVIFTAILCVSDIFAWTCNGKSFPGARIIVEGSNMIYFIAIPWTCYFWLNYVNIRIHGTNDSHQRSMYFSAAPVLVITILVLLNPVTNLLFSVDENNVYSRGNGVILHWIVNWGYLFWATGLTLVHIRRAKSNLERKQYYPLLWFIILPVIAAVSQMLFYGMTAMQCGITLATVMITFGDKNAQISSDALTGLNNRKALENYLLDRLQKQGQLFSVLFCDIDHFKSINDTFGHARGDLALTSMAAALKSACAKMSEPMFLCRYGGDEFILCGVGLSEDALNAFVSNLQAELDKLNSNSPLGVDLNMSYGLASAFCEDVDSVETLIHQADSAMYEMKNSKKR